jgi:rRNA biogenesis protein RRP5
MKIFGQVIAILPLALIISLPNQLFAHVPITNISTQFTELLERMESQEIETNLEGDDEEEEDKQSKPQVPELSDIFKVGQYVRAVVSAVHAPGASDTSGVGRSRDDTSRASKRVELCLIPERVNSGVQKSDLKAGFARIFFLYV